MNGDLKVSELMGYLFILIGIVGFIAIVATYDYEPYKELSDDDTGYSSIYDDDDVSAMQEEMEEQAIRQSHFNNWVIAFATLLVNSAIGIVLITLGRMHGLMEVIANNKDNSKQKGTH